MRLAQLCGHMCLLHCLNTIAKLGCCTCCRCVPVLQHLTFITPNANELLTIAAAVQQQQHTSSHTGSAASSNAALQQQVSLEQASCPQQLLAQLAPAAATVLSQGKPCCLLLAACCVLLALCCLLRAILHWSCCLQQDVPSGRGNCVGAGLSYHVASPDFGYALGVPVCPAAAAAGLKHIILTMGSQGAALLTMQPQQHHSQQLHRLQSSSSSRSRGRRQLVAQHIPAAHAAAVVNLSGAGDTLTGGVAAALLRGANLQEALAVGVAAAKLAVECSLNVPGPTRGMRYSSVWQQAQQLLGKMQVWEFPAASAL